MKKSLSFTVIAVFILHGGFAQAAGKKTSSERWGYCAVDQVEILQIANDVPGMMQSRAFFAVLNHGQYPCTLHPAAGLLWSNNKTPPRRSREANANLGAPERRDRGSIKRYILSPAPADGKMTLKEIYGFSVSNNEASGTGEPLFSSILVQLPNAEGRPSKRLHEVAYKGYATSPILKQHFSLIPFLAWKVLETDDCQTAVDTEPLVGVGTKGRNISARTLDVRKMLECG